MTTLSGKTPSATYKDLLQVSNANSGVDATLRPVEDGEGTQSVLQLSTSAARLIGPLDFTGTNHAGLRLIALTAAQRDAITPLGGMLIFNTSTGQAEYYNGAGWIGEPSFANYARLDTAQVYTRQQNTANAALTDAATIAWDMNLAQVATVTLGGNRTLANPTNIVDGGSYRLIVKQDATGGRTLTFGSAYKWAGGSVPILSTGANAVDVLVFTADGANMLGGLTKAYA